MLSCSCFPMHSLARQPAVPGSPAPPFPPRLLERHRAAPPPPAARLPSSDGLDTSRYDHVVRKGRQAGLESFSAFHDMARAASTGAPPDLRRGPARTCVNAFALLQPTYTSLLNLSRLYLTRFFPACRRRRRPGRLAAGPGRAHRAGVRGGHRVLRARHRHGQPGRGVCHCGSHRRGCGRRGCTLRGGCAAAGWRCTPACTRRCHVACCRVGSLVWALLPLAASWLTAAACARPCCSGRRGCCGQPGGAAGAAGCRGGVAAGSGAAAGSTASSRGNSSRCGSSVRCIKVRGLLLLLRVRGHCGRLPRVVLNAHHFLFCNLKEVDCISKKQRAKWWAAACSQRRDKNAGQKYNRNFTREERGLALRVAVRREFM